MGNNKRILILSIRAGAGHLRAAQALETVFQESYPDADLQHLDALEYTNAAFRKGFTNTYEFIARELPSVWGLMYDSLEKKPADSRFKKIATLFDSLNARPLRKEVDAFQPDHIVCTHYVAAEALSAARKKGTLSAQLHVTLTDYDIHTMWIQDGVDHYYVATEEMAYALREKGIGDARVHVTGIPIFPAFAQDFPARADMRKQLGFRTNAPTVLLSAGGFGLIRVDEVVATLAERLPDAQFLAVAGKNEKLYKNLCSVAKQYSGRVHPFEFVDNMHELMAASDLMVAKCGGLTTSECLAIGLPMVIIKPIPGQEERNAIFLMEHGIGVWAHTAAHMMYKVESLLRDKKRLRTMQQAALKQAHPDAAYRIVETIMQSK